VRLLRISRGRGRVSGSTLAGSELDGEDGGTNEAVVRSPYPLDESLVVGRFSPLFIRTKCLVLGALVVVSALVAGCNKPGTGAGGVPLVKAGTQVNPRMSKSRYLQIS